MADASPSDEDRWLADARASVKRAAYYMDKAMDANDLHDALRHAAALLGELRTSALSPPRYYDLHVTATQHVARLSTWLQHEPARGRALADAYATVQHAGNVLPRVYLLAAAAAARAAAKEEGVDAAALLADVADAARGVQHPLRGLFLRAHLLTALRAALPADPAAAADFVLTNFADANRLWVRMGVHGRARAAATAAARTQLADLVGKHITLLSSLDGVDGALYASTVLPRLLDGIVQCKDGLAQHYLSQAVVAAFPAAFHAATLPALLAALPELQPDARVAAVFGALLDRLAAAAVGEGEGEQDADAATAAALRGDATYAALSRAAAAIAARPDTPAGDVGALFGALARFGSATGGDAAGATRADAALAAAADAVAARGGLGDGPDAGAGAAALVALLKDALTARGAAAAVRLAGFTRLAAALPPAARRDAAGAVASAVADGGSDVGDAATVAALLRFVAPLADGDGAAADDGTPPTMDAAAATLLARVVHRLRSDDVDAHYGALGAAHAALAAAAPPAAAPRLLPPLAFSALSVAARCLQAGAVVHEGGDASTPPPEPGAGPATAAGALQFAGRVAAAVADADPALGLALHVAAAGVAGEAAALEPVAYDLYEQAFALFEEGLPDSVAERSALALLAGALARAPALAPDARDALAHKLAACGGRLLRRADQCRAALGVARVHWPPVVEAQGQGTPSPPPPPRDGKKALACLQRALKAAAAASTQAAAARRGGRAAAGAAAEAAALHVDVLNAYLDLVADGCDAVKDADVAALAKLTGGEVEEAGDETAKNYWLTTRARAGGAGEGRLAALKL